MKLDEILNKELDAIKKQGLYREIKVLDYPAALEVKINGKFYLNLASNNYLNYAEHPEIKEAAINAINKYGTGSTGSRLITGTTPLHDKLERTISNFKSTESAMFMSCGFITNVSTISALAGKQDVIFSDELNHASIIDGIRLSGAQKFIYKHNNTPELEELLKQHRQKYNRALIITDTIFSMDGDRADLVKLIELKNKYKCIIMVDEAHATGIYGKTGAGLAEELSLSKNIDIQMGTFSKAIGIEGGYIAGSKLLIDYLRHNSRGFIYSTAPSPAIAGAIIKAMEIVKEDRSSRELLKKHIDYFKSRIIELEKRTALSLIPTDSAIFCLNTGNVDNTMLFYKEMFEKHHILVSAIRPPTVKTSRIRICLSAGLTKASIERTLLAINNSISTLDKPKHD